MVLGSNPGWAGPSSSCHHIFMCVNYDLNGSLPINSRLHVRLDNQISHPIPSCSSGAIVSNFDGLMEWNFVIISPYSVTESNRHICSNRTSKAYFQAQDDKWTNMCHRNSIEISGCLLQLQLFVYIKNKKWNISRQICSHWIVWLLKLLEFWVHLIHILCSVQSLSGCTEWCCGNSVYWLHAKLVTNELG